MTESIEAFDLTAPLLEGTTVLEASAGTGKTYAIAAVATRALAEGSHRVDQLVMITFGRKASAELRSRVHERLQSTRDVLRSFLDHQLTPEDPVDHSLCQGTAEEVRARMDNLTAALGDLDRATIDTTHEFCQRMLGALGLLADHDRTASFTTDFAPLTDQATADLFLTRFADQPDPPPFRDACQDARMVVDRPGVPLLGEEAAVIPDRVQFAAAVRTEVEARKRRLGVFGFDDMVGRLLAALKDPVTGTAAIEALNRRFSLVLVDEFQDTDPQQWEILHEAFHGRCTMLLIGDPKQSIYFFRGADVFAYLDARKHSNQRRTLPRNFRSDPGVVEGVARILGGTNLGSEPSPILVSPVEAALKGQRVKRGPDGPAPVQIRLLAGRPEAKAWQARKPLWRDVCGYTAMLLDGSTTITTPTRPGGRLLRAGDIAIIVQTNSNGRALVDALRESGIPAVVSGGQSVFESDSAQDWSQLLAAIAHPSPRASLQAALTSLIGWDLVTLADPGDRLAELAAQLHALAGLVTSRGVLAGYELLCAQFDLIPRLLALPDGERRLTDVLHLAQLLDAEQHRRELSPADLVAWLSDQCERSAGDQDQERVRRLETDRSAVQVLTVHGAKGLEFPVVLVPDLTFARVGDRDDGRRFAHLDGRAVIALPGVGETGRISQQYQEEEAAESLRRAYVAMTRAASHLVIWWTPSRQTPASPLQRILMAEGTALPRAQYPVDADLLAQRVQARGLSLVRVEAEPPTAVLRTRPPVTPPTLRRFGRPIDRAWTRTSYTGLTRQEFHGPPVPGPEPDEPVEDPQAAPVLVPGSAGSARGDQPSAGPDSLMADMPGGTSVGTIVHQVFEQVDPGAADLAAELTRLCTEALLRFPVRGLAAGDLAAALHQVLLTPLGRLAPGRRLCDIPRSSRLAELDFEIPMGGADRSARGTVRDLAALFSDDGLVDPADPLHAYGAYLAASPVAEGRLAGFLTGSIDAALRVPTASGEAILVVDYKTNRLPVQPGQRLTVGHYTQPAMARAMIEAHYPLQALLYCVAMRRYLRLRGPDRSAELSGVGYLFVRGMAGATTPLVDGLPHGVFSWFPTPALVTAADAVLSGGGGGGDSH